ncbi:hypothetical protein ACHAXS_012831 [Conticribra weissflogii]
MISVVSFGCLLLGHAAAQKVNLHEINEKAAFIRSSSLSATTASSSAAATSQQTYADESATNNTIGDDNDSEEVSGSDGNTSSNNDNDNDNDDDGVRNNFDGNNYRSPFLSATLPTELSPVPYAQEFDSEVKSAYSSAYSQFLEKVFQDQQVYNVKILSVNIFDDRVVPIMETAASSSSSSSSSSSHHVQPSMETPQTKYFFGIGSRTKVSAEYGTLTFDAVVSAEHVPRQQQRQEQQQSALTDENFKKILIHVSHKFNSHLVDFLQNTGEEYFMDLEKVVVDDFETVAEDLEALGYTVEGHTASSAATAAVTKSSENGNDKGGVGVAGLEGESLNTASIVAIVLGSLAFIILTFATVKIYRREQQLKKNRWRSKEISNSAANSSMVGSLKVLYQKPHHPDDDYSFNPLGTDTIHTGIFQSNARDLRAHSASIIGRNAQHPPQRLAHPRSFLPSFTSRRSHPDDRNGYANVSLTETGNNTTTITTAADNNNVTQQERKDSFTSVWPQSTPLFSPPPMHSLDGDNDVKNWPIEPLDDPIKPVVRQHVYAPPGKVGVAIDVINGQPVVHKVKKGSPLEGLLKPMDIVVAIDDVDTTCMSAADVTHLMVKRMNYRRKISIVRPEE